MASAIDSQDTVLVQFRIGVMDSPPGHPQYREPEQLWADHPGAYMEEFLIEIPASCRDFAADIARGHAFLAGWQADNTVSDLRIVG